jgi:hypothetical protein
MLQFTYNPSSSGKQQHSTTHFLRDDFPLITKGKRQFMDSPMMAHLQQSIPMRRILHFLPRIRALVAMVYLACERDIGRVFPKAMLGKLQELVVAHIVDFHA